MSGAADRQGATHRPIRMCEMAVAVAEGTLRTLLGSCIGLALYDRKGRVGGLAHILLPRSNGKTDSPGKFVDTAVPSLIRAMEERAGATLDLVGKIAGGATMFANRAMTNIGLANVEASERVLREFRIPIVARDCGGEKGRRMSFDVRTGLVIVEVVGQEAVSL